MKPLKLSKKSNPLGDPMNLQDEFNNLKNKDHSKSFDELGEWLDHNAKKPRDMKSIYKIAASIVITTLVFIACSVPVSQDEEIGYMIKGLTPALEIPDNVNSKVYFKEKFEQADLDMREVSVHQVLHEEIGNEAVEMLEVVMALPEANRSLAESKMASLSKVFDFESVEILPIEETVERTMFESALHKFDVKLKHEISEVQVAAKINKFLHENSAFGGEAEIKIDEKGNRYVEIEMPVTNDMNQNVLIKRSVEKLHNELTPEANEFHFREDVSKEELIELKIQKEAELKEFQIRQKENNQKID